MTEDIKPINEEDLLTPDPTDGKEDAQPQPVPEDALPQNWIRHKIDNIKVTYTK